jgi:hypothetical protein
VAIRFLKNMCIPLAMNSEFQDGFQKGLKSVTILIKNSPDRIIAPTALRYIFRRVHKTANIISCVTSVCLSVRMEELGSDRMDFHEI